MPRPTRASVLVTGGAGFIGAALARELVESDHGVVALDDLSCGRAERLTSEVPLIVGDIAAPGVLEGVLAAHGPFSFLVHLAARVGVRRVLADPEGCRDANVSGARAIVRALAALPEATRPRLFAASTSEVYREKREPLDERDPLRPTGGVGRWAYAGSKRAAEELFDAADLWGNGRGPVHLRFFNVVGPGQDAGQGMVLPTFVEQALRGEPLTVHGDGAQVRTLAHVDDVAADLARMLTRADFPAGPLNLGGTARCSVLELASCVVRHAGGRIVRVDPLATVSRRFEEVRWREPALARARRFGLARSCRSLEAIVGDTLERHAARCAAGAAALCGGATGTAAALAGAAPCASPAS